MKRRRLTSLLGAAALSLGRAGAVLAVSGVRRIGWLSLNNADSEQSDIRRGKNRVNVFFGPEKSHFGVTMTVFFFNSLILVISSLALMAGLYAILRRQLRTRGT